MDVGTADLFHSGRESIERPSFLYSASTLSSASSSIPLMTSLISRRSVNAMSFNRCSRPSFPWTPLSCSAPSQSPSSAALPACRICRASASSASRPALPPDRSAPVRRIPQTADCCPAGSISVDMPYVTSVFCAAYWVNRVI